MIYWIIAVLSLLTLLSGLFYKTYLPTLAKKRAKAPLLKLLLPSCKKQQEHVINILHQLTNHRYTNDQVLDYFIKLRGLQTLDFNVKSNFWIKKYLLSPTEIRLNYFEQVKFYETFMNYPGILDVNHEITRQKFEQGALFSNDLETGYLLQKEYA